MWLLNIAIPAWRLFPLDKNPTNVNENASVKKYFKAVCIILESCMQFVYDML